MSKGSIKLNKLATRSKLNNIAYNKNAASRFGSTKFGFKDAFKSNTKSNTDIKK